MTNRTIRVRIWNEGIHEVRDDSVRAIYPDGMHAAIAAGVGGLLGDRAEITTATLASDGYGLSEEELAGTDVLTWWGHAAHDEVPDDVVERVQRHVLGGMGLVALHSAHFSKIFRRLLGTTCSLAWRNDAERETVWTTAPAHPIARGVPQPIVIDHQEMYGEFFDIPQPDDLVFVSNFAGGEVFRSGVTFTRGHGRIFYFSPGDQEYPVYHHPDVHRVLANGIEWVAPDGAEHRIPEVSNPGPRFAD